MSKNGYNELVDNANYLITELKGMFSRGTYDECEEMSEKVHKAMSKVEDELNGHGVMSLKDAYEIREDVEEKLKDALKDLIESTRMQERYNTGLNLNEMISSGKLQEYFDDFTNPVKEDKEAYRNIDKICYSVIRKFEDRLVQSKIKDGEYAFEDVKMALKWLSKDLQGIHAEYTAEIKRKVYDEAEKIANDYISKQNRGPDKAEENPMMNSLRATINDESTISDFYAGDEGNIAPSGKQISPNEAMFK